MLFMGEEWGASTPWMYFTDHTDPAIAEAVRRGRRDGVRGATAGRSRTCPTRRLPRRSNARAWTGASRAASRTRRLLAWYRDLIALRRERADLRDPRLDRVRVEHDVAAGTVLVHRGAHVVAVNLDRERRTLVLPSAGLSVVLAWDAADVELAGARVTLAGESAAILGPESPAPVGCPE